MNNKISLSFLSHSVNESLARSVAGVFALQLNPSLSELSDIKTAVSEAVTNSVVHAYTQGESDRKIVIECRILSEELHIEITDYGCGIEDVERAQTPFYTTLSGEERSGMGFTIMQTFMDGFSLQSVKGKGTRVAMMKRIGMDRTRERVDA